MGLHFGTVAGAIVIFIVGYYVGYKFGTFDAKYDN